MKYDKMKRKAEQIRLTDEQKERIIRRCEEFAAGQTGADSGESSTQIYNVERVDTRRQNIVRIISSVAACAVIAGAIGTTAHLARKQGGNDDPVTITATQSMTSSQAATAVTGSVTDENKVVVSSIVTEITSENKASVTAVIPESTVSAKAISITDFFKLDYTMCYPGADERTVKSISTSSNTINAVTGDTLSADKKALLSDFFNNMTYTHTDPAPSEDGMRYERNYFTYFSDNAYCIVRIARDGFISYTCINYETAADGTAHATNITTENYIIDNAKFSEVMRKVYGVDEQTEQNIEPTASAANNTGYTSYYSSDLRDNLIADIRNGQYNISCGKYWGYAIRGLRFPDETSYEDYTYGGIRDVSSDDLNSLADLLKNADYDNIQSRSGEEKMDVFCTMSYDNCTNKCRSVQFSKDGWVRFREYEYYINAPGDREPEYIITTEVKTNDYKIEGYTDIIENMFIKAANEEGISLSDE